MAKMSKILLNKLYDKRDKDKQGVQRLINKIAVFSNENGLTFATIKWFEYAYCLLYSGYTHRGKVLDVGSAQSVLPYYLASKGCDVTTIDICDSEYRENIGKKFNIKTITADLINLVPGLENQFDFITNLSVIEHIDKDTQAIKNLARYLKPNGVMVISTDFYKHYIEYPDANRMLVVDRPAGSHCDSRVYTTATFMQRIIEPLEDMGVYRVGLTNYNNVSINDPKEYVVRGLYTFGIAVLRKKEA